MSGNHLALHRHAGLLQGGVQALAFGMQQVIGAQLHEDRRQAAQISMQRRHQRLRRIATGQVARCAIAGPGRAEHGLAGPGRRQMLQRQIDPGCDQVKRRGQRLARGAQGQAGGQGQTGAGRITRQHQRARTGASSPQRPAGGQGIVQGGGMRVLRRRR